MGPIRAPLGSMAPGCDDSPPSLRSAAEAVYRAAAQREVDELTTQKDGIASHLAQVRGLFGAQVPAAG